MKNQYNNDLLPFYHKIVGMEIPDDISSIEDALKTIIDACVNLYGIVIGIFKKHHYLIKLNNNVPEKTMLVAERIQCLPDISDELDIIPFPHK
jgi:hypothetical protein